MPEITANYTAKHLAEVLEAVEQGERFTVVRRGRAVAELTVWEQRGELADVSVAEPAEPGRDERGQAEPVVPGHTTPAGYAEAGPTSRPGFFRRHWPLGRSRAVRHAPS